MWQEYLGTKALVHAVVSDDQVALTCADDASQPGAPAEARALAAMARAVIAAREHDMASVAKEVASCSDLGIWDSFVCAVRSYPPLLELAIQDDVRRSEITRVLARSHDVALARQVGLRIKPPSSSASPLLSPREREVLELVKKGLTNREIGSALFISEATAKAHVHHLMEKLQVKTRTAAASCIVN
jgi:DNA-binding CsgD family transcriptional regulator